MKNRFFFARRFRGSCTDSCLALEMTMDALGGPMVVSKEIRQRISWRRQLRQLRRLPILPLQVLVDLRFRQRASPGRRHSDA